MRYVRFTITLRTNSQYGECLKSYSFSDFVSACNFAFKYGRYFESFYDNEKDIFINHIDALTAYYENMMV